MLIEQTVFSGLVLLTPARFGDARGWFSEVWNADRMAAAGIGVAFVQDNHSFSAQRGTLRGLHCQLPPFAQDKLVRCVRGAILDVCVDIRHGSRTYGRWFGVELTADSGRQIFVPKGFLHGFVTLEDGVEVEYKTSAPYSAGHDCAVRWDDPEIGIDWGLDGAPILSDKDARAPLLRDIGTPFQGDQDGAVAASGKSAP